eukprot:TRINITY_DN481_c0_g1_i12.p1 TRINITY_DN481_c0_g1~~TRINITY_DN481_c0_g1_i12.p1  ORF type:complete len:207 (+),score=-18.84 TRINITY_DN481_c0_g1_i12:87-707(+)
MSRRIRFQATSFKSMKQISTNSRQQTRALNTCYLYQILTLLFFLNSRLQMSSCLKTLQSFMFFTTIQIPLLYLNYQYYCTLFYAIFVRQQMQISKKNQIRLSKKFEYVKLKYENVKLKYEIIDRFLCQIVYKTFILLTNQPQVVYQRETFYTKGSFYTTSQIKLYHQIIFIRSNYQASYTTKQNYSDNKNQKNTNNIDQTKNVHNL